MPQSPKPEALPSPQRVELGEAWAELYLPDAGAGAWPTVVILNSSAGVCDIRERYYARFFAASGMAALVVDSFTPRGIKETTADQSQIRDTDMERDAYAAHDFLAADPRFNARRIAAMGVSKGGLAALNTALLSRRRWFNRPQRDFFARVALAPPAHMQQRDARTDGQPLLMLLAELDDYTGVDGARGYAARMTAAGNAAVTVKVYPGVHHAFERTGPPIHLPLAENFSHRLLMVEDDGALTDENGQRMNLEAFFGRRREYLALGGHAGGGTEEFKECVATDILRFLAAHAEEALSQTRPDLRTNA